MRRATGTWEVYQNNDQQSIGRDGCCFFLLCERQAILSQLSAKAGRCLDGGSSEALAAVAPVMGGVQGISDLVIASDRIAESSR